jgi:hypothetical protein
MIEESIGLPEMIGASRKGWWARLRAGISQFGKLGEMSRYAEEHALGRTQAMVGFTVDDFVKRLNPPFPTT